MAIDTKRSTTSINRNVTVNGRRTSIRLRRETWDAIDELCHRERLTVHEFCGRIAAQQNSQSLTSEIRAYTLAYYRAAASDKGHAIAGHGICKPSQGRAKAPTPWVESVRTRTVELLKAALSESTIESAGHSRRVIGLSDQSDEL